MNYRFKAALPLLGALLFAAPQAQSQDVVRSAVVGSGAVAVSDGSYRVNGTIGQGAIGVVRLAGANVAEQGFWHTLPAARTTGVESPTAGGSLLALQSSPNPFVESAQLTLNIPDARHVSLVLYDLLGQPVRTLLDAPQPQGPLTLTLAADDLPSGRYTAVLKAGNEQRTLSLTLVK